MKLYLARHGDYAFDAVAGHGRLTMKGEAEIAAIADFIKPLQLQVAHIFHSGKFRAKQSAEGLAQGFYCDTPPETRSGLHPDDDPQNLITELVNGEEDEVYVGHLPFLLRLVNQLLECDQNQQRVVFSTGTLLCLEQVDRRHWSILWMLSPELFLTR